MQSQNKKYGINVVSELTGLSGHVIRAWERRYGVVEPERTPTNRRRYSDADIARLSLLHAATNRGHAIGNIAKLSLDDLEKLQLLKPDNPEVADSVEPHTAIGNSAADILECCKESVLELNLVKLESALLNSERTLGIPILLESVVAPLLSWVGDSWSRGTLQIAQEHGMTEIIRHFLSGLRTRRNQSVSAPRIIVATPPGQYHEMGAMLAAAIASMQGWNVLYLGTNMPPSDIAHAVAISGARCVALSIIYPADDPFLARELLLLRECLPKETVIIAGGSACHGYEGVLHEVGASIHADIRGFQDTLATIRNRRGGTDAPSIATKSVATSFNQPALNEPPVSG